jgi:hypothetical protein
VRAAASSYCTGSLEKDSLSSHHLPPPSRAMTGKLGCDLKRVASMTPLHNVEHRREFPTRAYLSPEPGNHGEEGFHGVQQDVTVLHT